MLLNNRRVSVRSPWLLFSFLFFLCVWGREDCRILVPWPGIETRIPAVKSLSPRHRTAREVSRSPQLPKHKILSVHIYEIDVPTLLKTHQSQLCYYIVCMSPEKAMATHSSTLAWKIPWTEEPGGLQSTGLLTVGHDWATSLSLFTFMHWRRKCQPTPVFLPGESQGRGSPPGLPSMGSHKAILAFGDP